MIKTNKQKPTVPGNSRGLNFLPWKSPPAVENQPVPRCPFSSLPQSLYFHVAARWGTINPYYQKHCWIARKCTSYVCIEEQTPVCKYREVLKYINMNRCPGHSGVVILQSLLADCVTYKPKSICDFPKTERQVSIQALEAVKGTMNLPRRSRAVTKWVFAVG